MARTVQSLERGLLVLEALVKNSPRGITEIASELDLDKTVVHRLLGTLQSMGYVVQDDNRKYAVGIKLRQVGAQLLSRLDLRTLAVPYMHELVEHTRGVAHLAKMAENRAIYIEKVQHPSLAIKATDVGGEAHGYCSAAGKVLWAHLSPLELSDILRSIEFRQHTANTITDANQLQRYLAQVREQGYALDNEEHRLGLMGIGAPVFDHAGNVIASICVAEAANQTETEKLAVTREKVLDVARRLSAELGYANGIL